MGWFLEYEYALESAVLGVGQYETVGQNPWDEHPVTHLLKSDTTALVVYRVSEDVIAECYITVEDAEKQSSTDGFIPFVKASVARDYTCATVEELVEFLQEVCVKVGDISYLYRKE